MKAGTSGLNPYAASYIPLSRREGYVGGDESMRSMPPMHLSQSQRHAASFHFIGHGIKKLASPELSAGKSPSAHSSHGSFSQRPGEMTYKQMRDEDLEMDMEMEYLLTIFTGLSRESIADVYMVNNGDLGATIDMLSQLEIYSTESEEHLPDTLDIGDVPESRPSTSCASKHKNGTTVAAASSSVSS